MSDDLMLKCLIAFILGWLISRMMGNGFRVGAYQLYATDSGVIYDCSGCINTRMDKFTSMEDQDQTKFHDVQRSATEWCESQPEQRCK